MRRAKEEEPVNHRQQSGARALLDDETTDGHCRGREHKEFELPRPHARHASRGEYDDRRREKERAAERRELRRQTEEPPYREEAPAGGDVPGGGKPG